MTNSSIEKIKLLKWDNIFSIEVPLSWSVTENNGLISLYNPDDGVGAIQISFAGKNTHQPTNNIKLITLEFSESKKHDGVRDIESNFFNMDGMPASEISFTDKNDYWRVWHILGSNHLAFITYSSSYNDRNTEYIACKKIIESFKWQDSLTS